LGGIWGSREYFNDALIDIAGYKAGVVLSDAELFELMGEVTDVARILDPHGPGGGRVHSSSFEEAVVYLLYRLGNTPSPENISITIEMFHKYQHTPLAPVYQSVVEAYAPFLEKALASEQPTGMIDPRPLMLAMFDKHGLDGSNMVLELIEGANRDLHRSAWGKIRNIDWKDSVELRDLFKSAGLETQHGKFFDQRYIDYLAENFDKIDEMHWRKFEGFTAEFFEREGYRVALGPGSNDDGVDLRVYPLDADASLPPMMIVQCKRQKAKIEKALVKSVYADVVHEGATSGLIVTTSTLAPGAEATRTARNYPLETADRATLKQWLDKLRTG
jgi:restriction system protein